MREQRASVKSARGPIPSQPKKQTRIRSLRLADIDLRTVAGVVFIAAVAFIIYFPALNGGFIFDDDILLTQQPLIKAADGLYRFWFTTTSIDYWPVSNSNLWLEWRLWGMDPTGYHITALLLHVASACLLWAVLGMIAVPGAFLAALLFTIHPVNVEAVSWIAQRKSLLAVFFSLLSILAYLQSEARSDTTKGDRYYGLSLAGFTLAMLSKASATTLPVTLLLLISWLRPATRRDLVRLLPFAAIAVGLTMVNLWFTIHGSYATVRSAGFIERLLGAATALWFYLYKAVFPLDLMFVYPRWQVAPQHLSWWIPLAAASLLTGVLWHYRGDASRAALFCWLHFCGALLPALGFVDPGFMAYSLVADHYQYFAIVGVLVPAAALWKVGFQRSAQRGRWANGTAATATIAILSWLSWRQSALYANETTLYEATLSKNPQAAILHKNLGAALAETGRVPEAMQHYERALQLNPKDADAHNNLGAALYDSGLLNEAIQHYESAVRLNPNLVDAHNNLANALYKTGRAKEAIPHYETAIARRPSFAAAHNNLAMALIAVGRLAEAMAQSREALQLQSPYAEAHYSLGLALAQAGRREEAALQFQQALQLRPNFIEARRGLDSIAATQPSTRSSTP